MTVAPPSALVSSAPRSPDCPVCGPWHCPRAHEHIERGARSLVMSSGDYPTELPAHTIVTARLVLASVLRQLEPCCRERSC